MDTLKNSLVVFVHIPKSAGMTFRKILDRQYDSDSIIKIGPDYQKSIEYLKNLDNRKKSYIDCISGHIPYGIHTYFPEANVKYISFVRDPVSRVISEYHYFRERPELNPLIGLSESETYDIEEFLDYQESINMTNLQTRFLSGSQHMLDKVLPPYDELGPDILEYARNTVDKSYEFIGIVEKFDESLAVISRKMAWKGVHYVSRNINKSNKTNIAISNDTIKRINNINKVDRAIYDYIYSKFNQELAVDKEGYIRDVRSIKSMNFLYKMYINSGLKSIMGYIRTTVT